ncbi:MAG: Mo-dependent nitrogenase C-terminal domain-containing protein [Fusobacteriaceae bacterium]
MSKAQYHRADRFDEVVEKYFPQWDCPLFILKILDRILPSYCVFQKTIFIGDILVLYIPSLCKLNPFYLRLLEYRVYQK